MRSFLFLFLAVSEAILCGQQPGMATLHTTTRLVQMMGGRIWLESEEGRGSQFHFTVRFGV